MPQSDFSDFMDLARQTYRDTGFFSICQNKFLPARNASPRKAFVKVEFQTINGIPAMRLPDEPEFADWIPVGEMADDVYNLTCTFMYGPKSFFTTGEGTATGYYFVDRHYLQAGHRLALYAILGILGFNPLFAQQLGIAVQLVDALSEKKVVLNQHKLAGHAMLDKFPILAAKVKKNTKEVPWKDTVIPVIDPHLDTFKFLLTMGDSYPKFICDSERFYTDQYLPTNLADNPAENFVAGHITMRVRDRGVRARTSQAKAFTCYSCNHFYLY